MSDKESVLEAARLVYDRTEHPEVKRIMGNVIQLLQRGTEYIEFRGMKYPANCVCCEERINGRAVVLLGTTLIFQNEDHLVKWVGDSTADITIREVEPCTVN